MSISVTANDRLAALSQEKKELLRLLLEKNGRKVHKLQAYTRGGGSSPVRLTTSWAQERLWFMQHVEGVGTAYNIQDAVRLFGILNLQALQSALDALAQRHEVLRTVFTSVDGVPKQEILPERRFVLTVLDLTGLDEAEREAQVRAHKIEEARCQFDLQTGPLIRGRLLRVQANEHLLLVTMHHIVSDGWSLSVFVREFAQLYSGYLRGQRNVLEPLPIQYADYAHWQREWLQGAVFDKQLSYWQEQLSGATPQLELPADRPRPAVQSYRGGRVQCAFDAQLTARLNNLARRHDMTLFMVLYAGWAMLLSRLSGQADVIIGTPIANRKRPELESLIGFFVNSLALRIGVRLDEQVSEFLERAKEVTLGAYEHQDVPFEKVVEAVHPQRSLGRNPIFQVVLALQNTPKSELRLPNLQVVPDDEVYESAMFDLHLVLEERQDRILGAGHYATDLFDRQTIERWMESYSLLLAQMTEKPNSLIGDLRILTEREHVQIMAVFNGTRAAFAKNRLIHELFEEQVDLTPEATAVLYEGQILTYSQLNAKANQLAWYLKGHGVGPDMCVGICVERSLDMVVGLLGILKAGGAYVPLDPTYPGDRLRYMVEDAAPTVLLIQDRLKARLPLSAARLITLDGSDQSEILMQPTGNLAAKSFGLSSEHLAYVIYTSGSTGQPKGAMNEHRALINRIQWMQAAYQLRSEDRVLQKTPFSFDVSVWEFFWTLLYGAGLIVARPGGHREPVYLQQVIENSGTTVLHFVPSMLQIFLDQSLSGGCRSVRRVICSGEELSPSVQKRFFECLPGAQLANLYGPTEAAIDVTAWECEPEDSNSRVPIGRPIWNTQMHVLDEKRRLVPIGVVGELHIGGVGVGRGYLSRPELTAERFIGDLFGLDPQARLYKTGDLGRWRADGAIEYIGRNDFQVKIRGFRIELGEIEAALREQPYVKQAIVLAREDAGEKRLVAYVVPHSAMLPDALGNDAARDLGTEIVGEWASLYEETYSKPDSAAGPSFVSWNSSYTGLPIPEAEMIEWLNCTVERINALRPRKVLEIGCGVGLVLQHVAPHCEIYVGTDISASAITQLLSWTSTQRGLDHVQLLHRPATEFQGFEVGSFDMIILNSVVQYFPDVRYLRTVLEGAVGLLTHGGTIFVGDIRHLGLLSSFHSSVELERASGKTQIGQLKRRIAKAVSEDKELVVDPELFRALPSTLAGVRFAQVQLKRAQAENELTRYRYDVALHVGEGRNARPVCHRLEWCKDIHSGSELEAALEERRWSAIRLCSIPNRRLWKISAAQVLIHNSPESAEVGTIRDQLGDFHEESIDPDQFWRWGDAYGYDVQVTWAAADSPDTFEVEMLDRYRGEEIVYQDTAVPPDPIEDWGRYTNDPLGNSQRRELIPRLREQMKRRLPDHMMPSAWVLLKDLPLSPNGKVDRKALPAPQGRLEEAGEYVSPRSDLERTLAEVWAQVLRVDRVGLRDNFFELGGHSLLGMKLLARVTERFKVRLSVTAMFQYPTVEKMAHVIQSDPNVRGAASEAPLLVSTVEPTSDRNKHNGPAPLAYTQLAHWHLYHLGERRVLRGVASVMRLRGPFKRDALRAALAQVVRRHDALRTQLVVHGGIPEQTVLDSVAVDLQVDDLAAIPLSNRESEAQRLVAYYLDQSVSVTSDPLFEVRLLCLSPSEQILMVAMEHSISDAFSMQLLLRDLFVSYVSTVKGQPASLPPVAIQFPEYARWLSKTREDLVSQHGAYWRERLAGAPRLRFPASTRSGSDDLSGWGTARFKIDRDLKVQLSEWCRLRKTTLVMGVFCAYAALVLRWCKSSKTVIQFQSNTRLSPKVENTVGYFSSALYVHVVLEEEDTFIDFLNRSIEEYCNAHEHIDLGYLASQLPRPQFTRNTLFNWVPQGAQNRFEGLEGTADAIACSPALFTDAIVKTYDLDHEPSVVLYDTDHEILGGVYFPSSRFDMETMEAFGRYFVATIRALVHSSESRITMIRLAG